MRKLRDLLWCWSHDVCAKHRIQRAAGVCRMCEIRDGAKFEKQLSEVRKNAK